MIYLCNKFDNFFVYLGNCCIFVKKLVMEITIHYTKGLQVFDSENLLFAYKFKNEAKKSHMVLIFKSGLDYMLPSPIGIYIKIIDKVGTSWEVLKGINPKLVSGKHFDSCLNKIEIGKIVETKAWNNRQILLYDSKSSETIKFMCEMFGLRYTREQKLRALNEKLANA